MHELGVICEIGLAWICILLIIVRMIDDGLIDEFKTLLKELWRKKV